MDIFSFLLIFCNKQVIKTVQMFKAIQVKALKAMTLIKCIKIKIGVDSPRCMHLPIKIIFSFSQQKY